MLNSASLLRDQKQKSANYISNLRFGSASDHRHWRPPKVCLFTE
ncbi:hypothetical protein D019_0313 [Vibrio parahaemolyticus VP2007-095]|nr:hypothetical protein D019_0313 [Vibrio parahaemolyticus VP2007-095]